MCVVICNRRIASCIVVQWNLANPKSLGPALVRNYSSESYGLEKIEWRDNLFLFNAHQKIAMNTINMGVWVSEVLD